MYYTPLIWYIIVYKNTFVHNSRLKYQVNYFKMIEIQSRNHGNGNLFVYMTGIKLNKNGLAVVKIAVIAFIASITHKYIKQL